MNKFALTLLLFALFGLEGCQNQSKSLELINGKWHALELTEEGNLLPIDSNAVAFSFDAEKQAYTFKSTLEYKEAGHFYIQNRYLFTTDTINQASSEKSVELLKLSADTLILGMKDGSKGRILKLVRPEG